MRLLVPLLLAISAFAHAGPGKFKRSAWTPPAGSRLDLDALSKPLSAAETKTLDSNWQPKVDHPDTRNLRYDQPPAIRLPGQQGWLYQSLDCAQRGKLYRCRPVVLRLSQSPSGLAVQSKRDLGASLGPQDLSFEYLPPALADLDGDGQQEILVRYRRRGIESEYAADWLSILNLPDLANAITPRRIGMIKEKTGANECSFELYSVQLNRDKLKDLRVVDADGCDAPSSAEIEHDREHGDKTPTYTGIDDYVATPKRRFELTPHR